MDFKKLAPWNWFKDEEENEPVVPVKYSDHSRQPDHEYGSLAHFHREMNQLFDSFVGGLDRNLPRQGSFFSNSLTKGLLRPTLDVGVNDKEYSIKVEIPGVDQKDVKLEVSGNTLVIKGEKKQEKEDKQKDYYRMERSYGSFQRMLSLPEDADQDSIKASFKNGILTITMARKALPGTDAKRIVIQ